MDGSGAAVDLAYTPIPGWLDFIQSAASYEPNRFLYDYIRVTCDEEDVPWDDYLGDVRNPIFHVGAAGGFGETGLYTLSLLGSNDISSRVVRFQPPGAITEDFGHIDLWTADKAEAEVWEPILNWIDAHMPGQGHDGRYTRN